MAYQIIGFFKQGYWKKWINPAIIIITCITCLQQINTRNYNNINIFRFSSAHLLAHQPLYIEYPQQYFDFYLYHPSFTVLFMPFAFLPTPVTLCVWTLLTTLLFLRTVQLLPGIADTSKKILLLLVLPELINNQQYVQTNVLLVSLMLLAFVYFEKGWRFLASFFCVLAFCIKGYGGIVGLLFLLYPDKLKVTGYAVFWLLIISALPMLFVSYQETVKHYADWIKMISSDEIKEGMSVIGKWGKTHANELYLTIAALVLLATTFIKPVFNKSTRETFYFRGMLCCYLLVWVVLFNRAAESPTYFLAITGLAYWLTLDGFKRGNIMLATLVFVLVYLGPSDLFPPVIHRFFRTHRIKVYPFIIFFIGFQMQFMYRCYQSKSIPVQKIF